MLVLGFVFLNSAAALTTTTIGLSMVPAGEVAVIDVRNGEQDLGDTETFARDAGTEIQWRIEVGGRSGPWKRKTVDGADIKPVDGTDFCTTTIDLSMAPAGAVVDIRDLHGDLEHGAEFVLPTGIEIQWRIEVGGRTGPWIRTQTCGIIKPISDGQFCLTDVDLSAEGLSGLNPVVDIRDLHGDLEHGDEFVLPTNIEIQWRLDVGGRSGPWKRRPNPSTIDGTPCTDSHEAGSSSSACNTTCPLPS